MQVLAAIITIVGIVFTGWQLKNAVKNTKINTLRTEYDIFGKISEKIPNPILNDLGIVLNRAEWVLGRGIF